MTIAILTGGTSSEREIALQSAETVIASLKDAFDIRVYDFPREINRFLAERGEIRVAVPTFHGRGGEDGTIQGFLEILGVPYIFSGIEAHALGMNKERTKAVVAAAGIRTPAARTIRRGESAAFEHPAFVKPMDGGSSVGVTLARNQAELDEGIRAAFAESMSVLIEDFIQGEEFTVAVIDEESGTTALPVIQIKSKNAFFDLASKYDPSLCEEICPAQISDALSTELQRIAVQAHEVVGARHVSRSDFIVDAEGRPWFLEINTIPGMTDASLLPKAIKAAGKDFGKVMKGWIDSVVQS